MLRRRGPRGRCVPRDGCVVSVCLPRRFALPVLQQWYRIPNTTELRLFDETGRSVKARVFSLDNATEPVGRLLWATADCLRRDYYQCLVTGPMGQTCLRWAVFCQNTAQPPNIRIEVRSDIWLARAAAEQ